jgi:flagellar FliL protein
MAKSTSSNNKNPLSLVISILGVAFFVVIGVLVVAMAYIMFAPDNFPKPFNLVYANSGTSEPSVEASPEPTIIPTVVIMPGEGLMETMSTKIVNLAGSTSNQYIRITIVLEFVPASLPTATPEAAKKEGESSATTVDPNAELETRIKARMPMMDDIVITLLASKTYSDLYSAQGKEQLRSEIMNAINTKLPEFHVMSVYFTEFVVQ